MFAPTKMQTQRELEAVPGRLLTSSGRCFSDVTQTAESERVWTPWPRLRAGRERACADLNKSWAELHQAAARRKLDGVDTAAWTDVENKTELLESSFVTRQITWDSADTAGQQVAAKLPELHTDGELLATSFRNSAEDALEEQSSFEKQCR